MRRDIAEYGGPLVDWDGFLNQAEPDWAALFPIPECYRPGSETGECEGDFALSPRMAAQLWDAGRAYLVQLVESSSSWERLPAIAQPYANQKEWCEAYEQAAMRILARLGKGLLPKPHCTGEEMALHMIIDNAKEMSKNDEYGLVREMIGPLPATSSSIEFDHSFDWVEFALFEDHDVLMLYDMPRAELADPRNPVVAAFGIANLHPADWFKPFDANRINRVISSSACSET